MRPCILARLLALTGLLAAPAALAQIDAGLAAAGWHELAFAGRAANHYRSDGGTVLVESERSVSLIWRRAEPAMVAGGRLAWRWCVDASVPSTDLARRGGDDRAAILYVGFAAAAPDPADDLAAFAEAYDSQPLDGTVIGYVWGGDGAQGWVDNPWLPDRGRLRILEPAGARGCRDESVDLAADYRAAFGAPMPAVAAIAIGADTDDTASRSRVRLELRGGAPRP